MLSSVACYERVEMGSNGSNGTNGTNGIHKPFGNLGELDPGADDAPAGPPPPPPLRIREMVASCVRFVQTKYGVPLDGTSDTLSLVDQYIRDARNEVRTLPESADLVATAAGAYLGEVIRNTYGGEWFCDGELSSFRLYMERVYLAFNPVGMMREALFGHEEPEWNTSLAMRGEDKHLVEARIALMGAVPEDDYFLPSTRFDVVATAIDGLEAIMRDRGEEGTRFSKDSYRF